MEENDVAVGGTGLLIFFCPSFFFEGMEFSISN